MGVVSRIFEYFGNNFDTLDEASARDYIHVVDLALAHTSVLNHNKLLLCRVSYALIQ